MIGCRSMPCLPCEKLLHQLRYYHFHMNRIQREFTANGATSSVFCSCLTGRGPNHQWSAVQPGGVGHACGFVEPGGVGHVGLFALVASVVSWHWLSGTVRKGGSSSSSRNIVTHFVFILRDEGRISGQRLSLVVLV